MRSMTGFALTRREGEWGELALQLRAVNHRHLDLKIVVPEALGPFEELLRRRLRAQLVRGRVEAQLRWRASAGMGLAVNEAFAREVLHAARRLTQQTQPEVRPVRDGLSLLAWPGVVEPPVTAAESLRPVLDALVEDALSALTDAREREGRALAAALVQRLDRLQESTAAILERLPTVRRGLAERLRSRIEKLGEAVDAERVMQEAAVLTLRQDVDEELDRLQAHAEEVRRLLGTKGPIGRRLDFLMQELGREAGTLAAKAGDLQINRGALDCRVLIEEMREQVQNIE